MKSEPYIRSPDVELFVSTLLDGLYRVVCSPTNPQSRTIREIQTNPTLLGKAHTSLLEHRNLKLKLKP